MGWNQLQLKKPENRLFRGIAPLSYVYFCHSYFVKPKDVKSAAATTDYGGEFVSAIAVDNIYGVQFHPEKSQAIGLKILGNFNSLAIIFPAIDIKDGKVVRLSGKIRRSHRIFRRSAGGGAGTGSKRAPNGCMSSILDGAKTGTMQNRDVIIAIAKKFPSPSRSAGGIRSREDIQRLIDGGVGRVILGNEVISDTGFSC